jgi:hypothetical protein
METGPSVRCVLPGVGISDCSCVAEAGAGALVADSAAVLHADAARPIATAAAATRAQVLRLMIPPWLVLVEVFMALIVHLPRASQ